MRLSPRQRDRARLLFPMLAPNGFEWTAPWGWRGDHMWDVRAIAHKYRIRWQAP